MDNRGLESLYTVYGGLRNVVDEGDGAQYLTLFHLGFHIKEVLSWFHQNNLLLPLGDLSRGRSFLESSITRVGMFFSNLFGFF